MSAVETLLARQAEAVATPLLVDRPTAARMLNISIRHLDSLVKANRVPHTRLGARVAFSPSALADWVSAQVKGGSTQG